MPSPDPRGPLVTGEQVLTDVNELVFRQVHPEFVDGDLVTSQVFRANSSDEGMVSLTRSSVVSAAESVADYRAAGRATAGCIAVSVEEINLHDAAVIDDSGVQSRHLPRGHAYADFRPGGPSRSQARDLKLAALERGWAFRA